MLADRETIARAQDHHRLLQRAAIAEVDRAHARRDRFEVVDPRIEIAAAESSRSSICPPAAVEATRKTTPVMFVKLYGKKPT